LASWYNKIVMTSTLPQCAAHINGVQLRARHHATVLLNTTACDRAGILWSLG
jgi:hypothetical protein